MQRANTKKRKNEKEEEGDDKALTPKPCSSSTTKRSKIIHVAKKEPRFTSTAQVVAELLNCRPGEPMIESMGPDAPIDKDWQESIRFLLADHLIPDITAVVASYIPYALSALFVNWKQEDDAHPCDEVGLRDGILPEAYGIFHRFLRLCHLSREPAVYRRIDYTKNVHHLWRVASTDASWCFGPVDALSRPLTAKQISKIASPNRFLVSPSLDEIWMCHLRDIWSEKKLRNYQKELNLRERFHVLVVNLFAASANPNRSVVIYDDELNDRFDRFTEDTDCRVIELRQIPITKDVIWFLQQINAATTASSTAPATETDVWLFRKILSPNRLDLLLESDVRRSRLGNLQHHFFPYSWNYHFFPATRFLHDSGEHRHIADARYLDWYTTADENLGNLGTNVLVTAETLANHRMNYLREFFSIHVSDEKMRYYARIPEQYIKDEDWIRLNRPCQTCGRPRAFTFLVPDKDECDICTRAASAVSLSNGGGGGFSDHDVKLDQV